MKSEHIVKIEPTWNLPEDVQGILLQDLTVFAAKLRQQVQEAHAESVAKLEAAYGQRPVQEGGSQDDVLSVEVEIRFGWRCE